MRLTRRIGMLVLWVMAMGCIRQHVEFTLPEGAIPVRTPRDMDAPWLDNQEMQVRDRIATQFGRVSIGAYRMPQPWNADSIADHFDVQLKSARLSRHAVLVGRHYRLVIWSRGKKPETQFFGIAEIQQPASAAAKPSVLLVITPLE